MEAPCSAEERWSARRRRMSPVAPGYGGLPEPCSPVPLADMLSIAGEVAYPWTACTSEGRRTTRDPREAIRRYVLHPDHNGLRLRQIVERMAACIEQA